MGLKIGSNFVGNIMIGSNQCRKIMQGSNVVYAKPFVTFDEAGGTPAATDKYVFFGQAYGTLPTVSKNGYAFDGWFDEPQYGENEITSGTIVSIPDDHTLAAQWVYAPLQPTINYFSKTATSISFYITNNSPYTCTMYYEHNDNTPDLYNVSLGSGATSSLLTISGLTPSTSYTIYTYAYIGGYYSSVASFTQTTNANTTATPTFGTPYKTTTWRVPTVNQDGSTVSLYEDYSTNPPTTLRTSTLASLATYTYNTGLSVGGVTVYARAQASGKDMSAVASIYI